ncbi:hypothetical protein D3C76_1078070 [compost metagenome]
MRRAFTVNRNHRQAAGGRDFEHCQIGQAIGTDQKRFKDTSILQGNNYLIGVVDHMLVGNDVAALVHYHAGSERADLQLIIRRAVEATVINVHYGRRSTANGLVVTHRRLIGTVELRRRQLIELS